MHDETNLCLVVVGMAWVGKFLSWVWKAKV